MVSPTAAVSSEPETVGQSEDSVDVATADVTIATNLSPQDSPPAAAVPLAGLPETGLPESRVLAPDRPGAASSSAVEAAVPPASVPSNQVSQPPVEIPVEAFPTTRVMAPSHQEGRQVVNGKNSGENIGQQANRSSSSTVSTGLDLSPVEALSRSVVISPGAPTMDTAQLPLEPPLLNPEAPNQQEVDELIKELSQPIAVTDRPYQNSPSLTISNPSGFVADNFTAFVVGV